MDSRPGEKIKEEPQSEPDDETMRGAEMSGTQEEPDSDEDVLLPPVDVLIPKTEFYEEDASEESVLNQSTAQEETGVSTNLECNGHSLSNNSGEAPSTCLCASKTCEKDRVAEKIRTGEYIVVRKERSRSKVWERFASIYDAERKRYMGYVRCSNCGTLLSMKLGSGTTHLSRHVCKNDGSAAMSINVSVKVSDVLSNNCLEKCVEMCVRDLVPSSTVMGMGFRNLCQELVRIGAVHGNVNVLRLLPSADMLLKHVAIVSDHLRESIMPNIHKAVVDEICAMDIWTERVQDIIHAVVTSHYISNDWKICKHMLVSFEFPHVSDYENRFAVKKFLKLKLANIYLPPENIEKLTYVTSDSNECINSHIVCAASYIFTGIKKLFDEECLKFRYPEIWKCMTTGQLIVHYLRNNGLRQQLNAMIQQSLPSVWSDSLFVLEIVFSNYESINRIFTEKMKVASLEGWNRKLMTDIIPFLMKFKEVIMELQNHTYPTLHLVLVYISELKNLCTACPSDHPETLKIKSEIKYHLEEFEMAKEHYIATFLCPHTRLLKQLNSAKKGEVYEDVRSMCAAINACSESTSQPQPAKKSRFGSWSQYEEDDGKSLDEVNLYLATGKQESEDPSDLLTWWREKAKTFPKLSKVAQKVLCIPATCSPYGESSNLRAMIAVKDKCFAYDQVNDLLFMHNTITARNSQVERESNMEEKQPQ